MGEIWNAHEPLVRLIVELGQSLGFQVATEVEASESAWVDVVWFDGRVPLNLFGHRKPKIRHSPVLPVFGFEVELKTGLNAKHIKGSVSNLDILGAQVGIIVIGNGNILQAKKSTKTFAAMTEEAVGEQLMQRTYRWVYAEAQPRSRVVVMSEKQVVAWAKESGLSLQSPPA